MSKNFEIKKTVVANIKDKLERAQSAVLVDYRGLTVAEDTELRNQCRKAGVEYVVLKNTMITLAAKELGIEGLEDSLTRPTAVAFGYDDVIAPAKVISEYAKKNKKLTIKCGVYENKKLDVAGIEALAALPSREVLIAKIMGSMMSAVSKFVYVVEAIRKKQAGEE